MFSFPIKTQDQRNKRWFWVFVGPFFLGLLLFVYIPIGWSAYLSFFDARNTVTPTRFVGLDNYTYLLHDQAFLSSLATFIVFAAFIVPVTFCCSLVLALLVYRLPRFQTFFRSVFFLPTAVSYVIASMVWRLSFFNGARFGLANQFLVAAGGQPLRWLSGESGWHWVALVTLRLWLQVGFYMILFIAGLNKIPHELCEAAAIDGGYVLSGRWPLVSASSHHNASVTAHESCSVDVAPYRFVSGL